MSGGHSTDIATVTLSLDTIVGETYTGDPDGHGAPITIADQIVMAATKQIVDSIGPDLRRAASEAVNEQIRTQAAELVAEAMREPFQTTGPFGDPTGPAKSIRTVVGEQVKQWMAKTGGRDTYGNRRDPSPFEAVLATEVDKALRSELADTVKDAKAKVIARVQSSASTLLADAVKDGLR